MDTSGYTTDIKDIVGLSSQFSDIQLVYSSPAGYTDLFRATRYGKRYMLKCLKPEFQLVPTYIHALRKEFEIGLLLDHPNICHTIGFEEVPEHGNAIILEYIDGFTLEDAISAQNTPLLERIKPQFMPGGELFSALQYIHSKQITHRDLKPSNIMITHNGNTLKLIDFSLSDSDAFGILKQPAGTREYIAPEQLLSGAKADVRSDIYSLGVTIQKLNSQLHDPHLATLVRLCTQRDINQRPASIAQITITPHTAKSRHLLIITILLITATALTIYILTTLTTKGYLQL